MVEQLTKPMLIMADAPSAISLFIVDYFFFSSSLTRSVRLSGPLISLAASRIFLTSSAVTAEALLPNDVRT